MFGEIIPQALCSRYGLAIGAKMAWLVWILIALFFVIAWPLSKFLDCLLGHDSGTYYRRAELKELVGITNEDADDNLTQDEINIIRGAIDLKEKTAGAAMTPIERVSMLSLHDKFDVPTCDMLVQEGHSRWPVFRHDRNNIVGMVIVKTLLMLNPKDATPIKKLPLVKLPVVQEDLPLYQVLDLFQQGKSHMALVVDSTDKVTNKGIITLEYVVEELLGEEILDETDVFEDVSTQVRVVRSFRNELNNTKTKEKGNIQDDPTERDPLL